MESDNESENGSEKGNWKQNERSGIALDVVKDSELRSRLIQSESYPGKFYHVCCLCYLWTQWWILKKWENNRYLESLSYFLLLFFLVEVIEERLSAHGDLTQMSGHCFSPLIFSDGSPQVFPSSVWWSWVIILVLSSYMLVIVLWFCLSSDTSNSAMILTWLILEWYW